MSAAERDKWNERYCAGAYAARTHPTALLEDWSPYLRRGRALDVACGTGRNALYLARAGYQVDAVDISPVGLERGRRAADERGLSVRWLEADLDDDPDAALPDAEYDLIVWVRYVNRDLMPHLLRRLRPRGHLLCEQHLVCARPDIAGPSGTRFRLQPNELLQAFAAGAPGEHGARVLYYREGLVTDPDGRRSALAQLVGCRAPGGTDATCAADSPD
ncbi:MAG TPA: methyltransferase domain-containing protein [Gammaproteobacteria bacterium]